MGCLCVLYGFAVIYLYNHRIIAVIMYVHMRQQKMLQIILDNFFGKLNVSKWAKMTGISTDTALRDMKDLVKKGILEQEGSGRSTSYRVKNERK